MPQSFGWPSTIFYKKGPKLWISARGNRFCNVVSVNGDLSFLTDAQFCAVLWHEMAHNRFCHLSLAGGAAMVTASMVLSPQGLVSVFVFFVVWTQILWLSEIVSDNYAARYADPSALAEAIVKVESLQSGIVPDWIEYVPVFNIVFTAHPPVCLRTQRLKAFAKKERLLPVAGS
jgi:Zn-dependent protease with chaperone function